jgi:hypothetical protein
MIVATYTYVIAVINSDGARSRDFLSLSPAPGSPARPRSSKGRASSAARVEGKTFVLMALTVIIALAFAFLLSITFVPAMTACVRPQRIDEGDGRIVTWLERRYEPGLDRAMRRPDATIGAAVASLVLTALPLYRSGRWSGRSWTMAIA